MESNKVMMELSIMYQLPVVQYNALSSCFAVLARIPRRDAGVFVLPATHTVKGRSSRPFRPSKDPARTREDYAELWHLRAGHPRPKVLEKLVNNARNVRIKAGEAKANDCEACRLGKAHEIVSRRASENRSKQPFWRVSIDLFHFPRGYNGHNNLLAVKDEYSGGIWACTMANKDDSV
jgi:hypothetical protein